VTITLRLGAAITFSLLLHALVFSATWITPASPAPSPLPLTARLVPAPAPAAPATVTSAPQTRDALPARPAPRPRAQSEPPAAPAPTWVESIFPVEDIAFPYSPAAAEGSAVAPAESANGADTLPAESPLILATAPATLQEDAATIVRVLPRRGRISYTLTYGTEQAPVGRTVQAWDMENGEYRITSTSETTGLVSLFLPARLTYLSRGTLTPRGLQPGQFLMSRIRRGQTETAQAQFDWPASEVSVGRLPQQQRMPLPAGSQDIVSFAYQLALAPPALGRMHMPITTGTRFETHELEVFPEEMLDTPLGTLRALPVRQVRRPGSESLQVWLAADYQYLPVKLRFFGRDGEMSGEQTVTEIRLSE